MKIMLTPPIAAISAALSALVSFTAVANPTVTIDNVVQHFPWDGKIDITYTAGGIDNADDFVLKFHCVQGSETNELVTFEAALVVANGTRTATWDAQADGVSFPSGKADFLADLHTKAACDGDYMIVDVSGGPNAESFPVTFVSDVADPAATFNVDEYKLGKIVLKKVKAGTFLMGSPAEEEGRNTCLYYSGTGFFDDGGEEALHYVKISEDFFMGLFPVTGCQFTNVCDCAVTGDAADRDDVTVRPASKINYNNHLYGGTCFFDRINARVLWNGMGRPNMILPTESQWEYVCRAGTTTAYFFGADATDIETYAWCNNKKAYWWTQPVGGKAPNPWGFYDLIGNVYQYCQDTTGPYPEGTLENPAVDPVHVAKKKNYRVLRGSSYCTEMKVEYSRSACRMAGGNLNRTDNGFRLTAPKMDQSLFASKDMRKDVPIDTSSTKTDINSVTLTLVTNRVEHTGAGVSAPVVLTYEGRTLVLDADYALGYSDNVNVGLCTVTVTGKGDFAGTRLTTFRIVHPCVAESQRTAAKIDLRDGVLTVTVPGTLFNLAYNNVADWPQGGEASETVKAVISAAPLETAESEPVEGDFVTVLASDGEGAVKWRPTTRYTMVRFQIERDGVVDPESTMTRVIDATINGLMLIVR